MGWSIAWDVAPRIGLLAARCRAPFAHHVASARRPATAPPRDRAAPSGHGARVCLDWVRIVTHVVGGAPGPPRRDGPGAQRHPSGPSCTQSTALG